MNTKLTHIPYIQEIKEATFSIHSGKAPGPDEFSSKFYQAYWHIIGEDVSRDIPRFFEKGELNPQQNATHVRLIPKGSSPRKVSDYRHRVTSSEILNSILVFWQTNKNNFITKKRENKVICNI